MNRRRVLEELKRIDYKYMDWLTDEKIAWMDKHLMLQRAGYIGYDFTITYLPHLKSAKGHTSETLTKTFTKLYLHRLVRYHLFNGDAKWAKKYQELQPFTDVFLEAHEHGAIHRPHWDDKVLKEYMHADRLHHHGLIFVLPFHAEKMDRLVGKDTLKVFSDQVMTSDLGRMKDIGWTGYELKRHDKYTDTNLFFGPKNLDLPGLTGW